MRNFILLMFTLIPFYAHANINLPPNVPFEKCEGLRGDLQVFAADLSSAANELGQSEQRFKEAFSWIVLEVAMSISESSVDCDYILNFVNKKHQEFLKVLNLEG